MKRPPMNAQDDMTAGLDGSLLVMIEMPIDTFESASPFVLGSQGIIDGQVEGAGGIAVAFLEITDHEVEQGQTQVVRVPGTDAEEVSQVAGIDAGQFQGGQLSQGLAAWCHDKEVAEAFDVLALRGRQRQAEEANEGDDGTGTLYDGFHGVSVLIPAGGLATFCRFRPATPFRPTRTRLPVNTCLNKRSVQLVDPAGPLAKLQKVYMQGLQGIADQAKAAHVRVAWITTSPIEKAEEVPG